MSYLKALKYRQDLIDKAAPFNKKNQEILNEAIKNGHKVIMSGTMKSPYMYYITHWISDGSSVTLSEPAAPHWAPIEIVDWFK